MKKIGFIDYYCDEGHANLYHRLFREVAGDEMMVCYAYGETDSPGGLSNKEWAKKYDVELCSSIEEVVEKSDCIAVLAPDDPDTHVRLSELALKSGKPVFIDKTFALSTAEAKQMLHLADAHSTPCYSSSALYFSDEIEQIETKGIKRIDSMGGGPLEMYAVHQAEPLVRLMGYEAERLMFLGENVCRSYLIEFSGGRYAQLNQFAWQPFSMTIGYSDLDAVEMRVESDYFANCVKAMSNFFKTGQPPVPHEQTITVVAIIEAMIKSGENPFEWVEIKA